MILIIITYDGGVNDKRVCDSPSPLEGTPIITPARFLTFSDIQYHHRHRHFKNNMLKM